MLARAQHHKGSIELILALALIASIAYLQLRFDRVHYANEDIHAPIHRYALPASVVKHFAFGFNNVLADYYWVTAIQEFSKWDRFDAFYSEYFRVIATLDPRFEFPYQFAILTVPTKVNPAAIHDASDIAERGIAALPNNWEIPFYLGVEYHTIAKSYEDAAHYIGIAAKRPESPEIVHKTYLSYLSHALSEYQSTRSLYEIIAETAGNKESREYAKQRMLVLDVTEAIEQAAKKYKTDKGMFPASLEVLIRSGYIAIPLESAKNFHTTIDPTTGKVTL